MRFLVFIFLILYSFNSFSSGKHNHDHDHDKKNISVKKEYDDHKHDHDKHSHDKKGSLGAHEHGLGVINIVQDHNNLLIELEMPGVDVVGFEYKAKSKTDKNKVDDALKVLKNPDNVIMLSQEGKCKLKKSKSIILEEKNHSEFRSEYSFSCKKVSNVKSIKINVFDKFKNSEKINLKVVGEKSSKNLILNRSNKTINLDSFSH